MRGDDDDKDQDAIRALEQIEMDKIQMSKIKIEKNKLQLDKEAKKSPLERFNEESFEDKKADLMKLYNQEL